MGWRTVIIHGPQGCGKTRNKDRLRDKFGCRDIIDDFDPEHELLHAGGLHLTNADVAPCRTVADVFGGGRVGIYSFTEAMANDSEGPEKPRNGRRV